MAINTPSVTLEPYEYIREKDELFDEDSNNGYEEVQLERANVLGMVSEEEKDRSTGIFELIDPDTLKGLDNEEIEHIKGLINERPHIFGVPGEGLKATHLVTHNIETTTNVPVRVKGHRHPPAVREEMQRQISKYLDEGIIRPSNSPYSSMMWVVPKKSGKNGEKRWCMVTDFRQLNEVTVGNSYPLPLTIDIIAAVASAAYIRRRSQDGIRRSIWPLRIHTYGHGITKCARDLSNTYGPHAKWFAGRRIVRILRRHNNICI